MPWQTAEFPAPPRGESRVVTVDDAFVTQLQRGPTASAVAPVKWIRGAVHDADGRLVPESQRTWAGDRAAPIATDPNKVKVASKVDELSGTWLYCGHFMPPFGHFIVETLTNLWVDVADLPEEPAGLLFHQGYRTPMAKGATRELTLKPWHADLFELAGHGAREKREVVRRPVRVERLVVPTRPVVFKSWSQPEAAIVWQRVAEAAGQPRSQRRVFLSRTAFNKKLREDPEGTGREWTRSEARYDEELDAVMAAAGFHVVEPQTLSITDQIRLVRGADVVAASAGSALHLLAFARPETRLIEIGDRRTPDRAMVAQRVIDAVYQRTTAFVPHIAPREIGAAVAALLP